METIIRDVMVNYLDEHDLLCKHQHGFRKKHSTGLQILECFNDWTEAIEAGDCVDVCYVDFARAFDTVSIPKLLHKLSAYGFKGQLLMWLTEFLTDRKLAVKVGNSFSNTITQISGIAQGTSIGPLCFSLFINDLPKCLKFSKCKLFADDAKIYFRYNVFASTDKFQSDLNLLAEWARRWQLDISVNKTFLLYLGKNNVRHIYKLNDIDIKCVEVVKDLGVYVSSDLAWHSQCVEAARKANSVANAILHAFVCDDITVYMKAFNAYVRPILEFNCYVWSPVLCSDIDLIENVQKTFTRRAFYKCNLPRMSYNERLKYLKLDSLELRRIVLSLCTFYNVYHGYVSCNILNDFLPAPMYLRGNRCRLFLPFCKSKVRKEYFTFKILPLWNALPDIVVRSNVLTAFKLRLHDCDFTRYLRWT
jgi:Reverse transcriptase (RNA-dependent DNA polymerase)